MSRQLPPLNAARAFEAAARHLSFLKAAEELGVTPGAVSQQVRVLEEWLARPLFRRLPKGVRLTEAGQELWPAARDALDRLADAAARVRSGTDENVLSVSTLPSFAARWLIPRLGRFAAVEPGLEVKVVASLSLADFSRDDVDLAVRFGGGSYPGLFCELLMDEVVFPVCSPALLAAQELRTPSDLRHFTLLHDLPDPAGVHELSWPKFLAAVGAEGVDAGRGPKFTFTHMSLSAAIAGQGVALATSALIGDDLVTGRLVRPLAQSMPAAHRYWIVCPAGREEQPAIAAFRAWAKAEAAAVA